MVQGYKVNGNASLPVNQPGGKHASCTGPSSPDQPGACSARAPLAGVFAWRQVSKFIPAQWRQYLHVYNGTATGFMRGPTNKNVNPLVTRYPTKTFVDGVKLSSSDPSVEPTLNPALQNLPDAVSGVRGQRTHLCLLEKAPVSGLLAPTLG